MIIFTAKGSYLQAPLPFRVKIEPAFHAKTDKLNKPTYLDTFFHMNTKDRSPTFFWSTVLFVSIGRRISASFPITVGVGWRKHFLQSAWKGEFTYSHCCQVFEYSISSFAPPSPPFHYLGWARGKWENEIYHFTGVSELGNARKRRSLWVSYLLQSC